MCYWREKAYKIPASSHILKKTLVLSGFTDDSSKIELVLIDPSPYASYIQLNFYTYILVRNVFDK